MKHLGHFPVMLVAAVLFAFPELVSAGSTSPGKNAAYESASALPMPSAAAPGVVATASILKGKPKRVLEATAMVAIGSVAGGTGYNLDGRLEANGVPMEPVPSGTSVPGYHFQTCYDDGVNDLQGCVMTITGWLDLDSAEEANPGSFKKQQIDVELIAGAFDAFAGFVSADVALSVRMEKK